MEAEMDRFIAKDSFEIVHRHSIPREQRILNAVWTFRRKTTPTGQVYRHRSRLCVDGSRQQQGIDYTKSYSPVVSWSTLRLLFILSIILDLKSRQVDYVQAFPQAELNEDIYMRISAGFYYKDSDRNEKFVLKLKRNLYGLKQAAFHWNELLTAGLIQVGFTQSESDPCLFLKSDIICVIYVDDTIFFAPKTATIESIITSLKESFELTDEGEVDAFLGIKVTKNDDKTIMMSQPGLIDQVIRTVGLENDSKQHKTPSVNPPLGKSELGADRERTWNYRSAIGQLAYISRNTRPDIEMAVHQCAKYQINPKRAHEQAVKRIVRYLLATKNKGIIIKPNGNLKELECYVDADFAGAYNKEDNEDPISVKSRT